jgi:hypothetical protein
MNVDTDGLRRRAFLAASSLLLAAPAAAQTARRGDGYPKVLGGNIGAKNYDDPSYQDALARADMVILGLFPGWRGDKNGNRFRELLAALKRRNPKLLVAQYTILNEASDDRVKGAAGRDRIDKLDRENWWLRTAGGDKTQWTAEHAQYDINISDWSKPDAEGLRYPQWLARRDHEKYFAVADFDAWYFDNVMIRSRVPKANWKLDGRDVSGRDDEVEAAFRRAMAAHWDAARKLAPKLLLMGNTDNDLSAPEYRGKLHVANLEGLMGKSWSLERREGWRAMMKRYVDVRANLLPPAIVGFNVAGRPDDFAFFRYAFCSSLLGDGWFSFTDAKLGYSSLPWFDEYEQRLGKPVDAVPGEAWRDGLWRRRYEHAMALVNPGDATRRLSVEPGWKRFAGAQDARTNDGTRATEVTLPARSGLLLVKDA